MITLFSLNILIINKNASSIVLKIEFVNLDKSLLFKMSSYFLHLIIISLKLLSIIILYPTFYLIKYYSS